jgi:hypothetical protein
MPVRVTSCPFCVHFNDDKTARCAAFPNGIPDVIFYGRNPHIKPFPDDHGIQFEPKPEWKEAFREKIQSQQPARSQRNRVPKGRNG